MARTYQRKDVSQVQDAINGILKDYYTEVKNDLDEIVPAVAKKCKQQIAKNAPVRQVGESQGYNRSWQVKTKKDRLAVSSIVCSKQWGLTHLLENGHLTRDRKTRSREIKHIAPAADSAAKELLKQIENKLSK